LSLSCLCSLFFSCHLSLVTCRFPVFALSSEAFVYHAHQLRTAGTICLTVYPVGMVFYGLQADEQFVGDLLIREPAANFVDNFFFSF